MEGTPGMVLGHLLAQRKASARAVLSASSGKRETNSGVACLKGNALATKPTQKRGNRGDSLLYQGSK